MKTSNLISEIILVTVTPFNGTTSKDKNGKIPVMLQLIAGTMPNRQVLSGTVAENIGVEIGKTYLMQVRKQGEDALFGEDFVFLKLSEVSPTDIATLINQYGPPNVVNIERPDSFNEDSYERITTAVEGLRTKRMKEGKYTPSFNTTTRNHSTAPEIVKGSTQESEDNIKKDVKTEDTKNALN